MHESLDSESLDTIDVSFLSAAIDLLDHISRDKR